MMTYIGVATGVCLGLRPGEAAYAGPYLGDPDHPNATALDHTYYLRDLLLEVTDDVEGVYCYDAYRALTRRGNRPAIDLITFVKDTSKTSRGDPDGLTHHVTRGNPTETTYFEDLLRWIDINDNDDGDNMLFSRWAYVSRDPRRRTHKKLTTHMYTTAIKGVAQAHDLPEIYFSGKSPRVNAITNSELAGNSSLRSRRVTGHRTESAARHYLHPGIATGPTAMARSTFNGGPVEPEPIAGRSGRGPTDGATVLSDPCVITVATMKRVASRGRARQDSKIKKPDSTKEGAPTSSLGV
jgi:hypothetical protein